MPRRRQGYGLVVSALRTDGGSIKFKVEATVAYEVSYYGAGEPVSEDTTAAHIQDRIRGVIGYGGNMFWSADPHEANIAVKVKRK